MIRKAIAFVVLFGLLTIPSVRAVALPAEDSSRFTLVIDAGHGGHDPGAIGTYAKEKNINLNVALAFGRLVEENCPDVRVIYTRKTDVFVNLLERANIANRNKADLFISIHTNSMPKGRMAAGAETYTLGMARSDENLEVAKRENAVILLESNYNERYAGFNPNSSESYIIFEFMQDQYMKQSVSLATLIQKHYTRIAKRSNRGVQQAGYLVLRQTSMPSVLTELGFISNPTEERYLSSEDGVRQLGRSIYEGFLDYKQMQDGKKRATPPYRDVNSHGEPVRPKEQRAPEDTRVESENTKPKSGEAESVLAQNVKTPSAQGDAPEKKDGKTPSEDNATGRGAADEKPVFKIQLLTADCQLKESDKRFRGVRPIQVYRENNLYKYTYGETTDYNEILRMQRKIRSQFPDAFVVAFKKQEKIRVADAIREFKRK